MRKKILGLGVLPLVVLLWAGCSPPELGPPESTGFLVVRSQIVGIGVLGKTSLSVREAFANFGEIETPEGDIIRRPVHGRFILFGGLKPGKYKLIRLTEDNYSHAIRIGGADNRLEDHPAYTVMIEPGKPTYIGVVKMEKLGLGGVVESTYRTSYEPNVEAEKEVWEWLIDAYEGTKWEARFKEKLERL